MSSGRSRGLRKQLSSEDQALNMIAKEAEARLAAKRAARAEARSIRMKELERKQREIDELENDEIDMPPRRSPSSRISSPAASASPSGSEVNLNGATVDSIKDSLKETEEKYRKAMVNAAQLDNERQALLYQVECLKDVIENLEESLHNVRDELHDKTKEHGKLTRDHEKTSENLKKCSLLLQDRERILDEHGINLDGTLKEKDDIDGSEQIYPNLSYSNHIETVQHNEERESFLSEIESLKNEIAELKSQQESSGSRKSAENTRMVAERGDLERSFVDVSTEAAAIQEETTHNTLYINNNEKCDDFEVIDNGSQQGGIRNFEDKSFEKSGRSSLMSSMMTGDGGVTDSMESEVPLEISIDKTQNNRDDYDIVQIEEPKSKRTTALDIQSLTARGERAPSPAPQSNINVNKYLFSDNDDEDSDEPVSSGTFNIDMYFCAEEKTEEKDDNKEETNAENTDDSQAKTVYSCDGENEQTEKGGSPFVDVEPQISDSTTVIATDVTRTDDDTSTVEYKKPDENLPDGTSSPIEDSSETLSGQPQDLDIGFISEETVDGAGQSTPSTVENEFVSDLNKASIISSGKFTENSPILVSDTPPIVGEVDKDIRKSVEDLYEQIAEETENDSNSTIDGLPKDATFGVFSITGTSDMSRDEEESNEGPSDLNTSVDVSGEKKEKWLVRVESFSMPAKKTPEIKVIESDNNHVTVEPPAEKVDVEPIPVPKERKKKKKKKGKAGKEQAAAEIQSSGDDLDSPSPPTSQHESEVSTPVESPSKRIDHSDIPKQFLDASTHLAGDSCSDVSDAEHEEFAEDGSRISKKRGSSKKGKSKESCKTQ